ncbi:MAG: 3-oxoacyl-ACP reductase FabG [Gammaproteobacteria bacterium]|nr:MAG: 3-oxoacyl-ACP reductase FabG [Gammaproteobacteria bacterium]
MTDAPKTALITGGAGGLGRVMAQALVTDGINTAILDIDKEAARKRAAEINERCGSDRVLAIAGDVSDENSCNDAVASCIDHFGSIDILVNNAGIGVSALRPDAERNLPSIEEIDRVLWDRFFAVNVTGPMLMTRAATPHMRANGWGRVVNNTTSLFTMLRVLPYGASKAALESMSAIWAKQLESTGITVNVLVPGGPTDTPFISDESGIPRDKMLKPAIMGPPIRWLASPASDGVTGRRFVAASWDADRSDAEAAKVAGAPIGWPELAKTVVWPD